MLSPNRERDKILSAKEVTNKIGLSRTTIWRMELKGDFPRRIILSPGRVGWSSDEIDNWIDTRKRF